MILSKKFKDAIQGGDITGIIDGLENEAGGNGGSTPPAVVPTADYSGVTVDTTTYDNTITGDGKFATLVFPAGQGQGNAVIAIAIEGDEFPRVVIPTDPVRGDMQLGDGTVDITSGAYVGLGSAAEDGSRPLVMNGMSGGSGGDLAAGLVLPNVGSVSQAVRLNVGGGVTVHSGLSGLTLDSEPGNVNDLYIAVDSDGTPLTYLYRCTVAGGIGAATWVGIL